MRVWPLELCTLLPPAPAPVLAPDPAPAHFTSTRLRAHIAPQARYELHLSEAANKVREVREAGRDAVSMLTRAKRAEQEVKTLTHELAASREVSTC